MSLSVEQAQTLVAARGSVRTEQGDPAGTVVDIFFDTANGVPNWALVAVDSSTTRLVPMTGARPVGHELVIPLTAESVLSAPAAGDSGPPDQQTERALLAHYQSSTNEHAGDNALSPQDESADDVVIRSEEQLKIGLETRAGSRVKISKHVVAEQVTQTVTVRREELRIERIPIADDEGVTSVDVPDGGDHHELVDQDWEIVLYEERVILTKVVVPVERIRLGTRTVTEEVTVAEELRSERIELAESDTAP